MENKQSNINEGNPKQVPEMLEPADVRDNSYGTVPLNSDRPIDRERIREYGGLVKDSREWTQCDWDQYEYEIALTKLGEKCHREIKMTFICCATAFVLIELVLFIRWLVS